MNLVSRRGSPLALIERISPNKTTPRTRRIRRLTPHAVAGNLSVERILNLRHFVNFNPRGGASCNYAIGGDGRIGLCVEETSRSWTSSNLINDMEAITFEIANSSGGPEWQMTEAALDAWVRLSVDIAKFYGYKRVSYYGNRNALGAQDEMIVTLHRWFANKSCPGPFFIRQLPRLLEAINFQLKS